jgi:hypothetical protein
MLAAISTLVFLFALWLVVVVTARTLEESGGKILRALGGQSVTLSMSLPPVRQRSALRRPFQAPVRARAVSRAAA